eukprot:m51a1_g14689 hypothetical protein (142) ;mRNA; f:99746-100346
MSKRANPYAEATCPRYAKCARKTSDEPEEKAATAARTIEALMSAQRGKRGRQAAPAMELSDDEGGGDPSEACSCCHGRGPSSSRLAGRSLPCAWCSQRVCAGCARTCAECGDTFCTMCSVINYDQRHERAFCLNCEPRCHA